MKSIFDFHFIMNRCWLFLIFFCGMVTATVSADMAPVAKPADTAYAGHVRAELLSDVSSVDPGGSFWVGLRMTMDDGWHTYWRNSGDSGLATSIEWELPHGFKAGPIRWPYPKRFDYNEGLVGYGYDGEVILLTEINTAAELTEGQKPVQAKAKWLSCKEICVPGSATLSIQLLVQISPTQINEEIRKSFKDEQKRWPLAESRWLISANENMESFFIKIVTDPHEDYPVAQIMFFPYRNDIIDHAGDQILWANNLGYKMDLSKSDLLEENNRNIKGVLVSSVPWQDGRNSLLIDVPVTEKTQ